MKVFLETAALVLIGTAALAVVYIGLSLAAADLRKRHRDTPCIGAKS